MAASVVGLSDGDLLTFHPPYSGLRAELYGENGYAAGKAARAVFDAALANGIRPGPLYDFQEFASQYYTAADGAFGGPWEKGAVSVQPEVVTVDGNPLALARQPQSVFDYGACLTGRSYVLDQAAFVRRGLRPFAYLPLTRLHFTNETLFSAYSTTFGRDGAALLAKSGAYVGREDGVAAATDETIRAQRAHNAPVDIVDIVLAAGAQHTTRADMKRGIQNAHVLLREAGMLVVRSLARPAPAETGTEEIVGWALDAGFEERHAVRYEAALDKTGVLLASGHFGDREIQTVILKKLGRGPAGRPGEPGSGPRDRAGGQARRRATAARHRTVSWCRVPGMPGQPGGSLPQRRPAARRRCHPGAGARCRGGVAVRALVPGCGAGQPGGR